MVLSSSSSTLSGTSVSSSSSSRTLLHTASCLRALDLVHRSTPDRVHRPSSLLPDSSGEGTHLVLRHRSKCLLRLSSGADRPLVEVQGSTFVLACRPSITRGLT